MQVNGAYNYRTTGNGISGFTPRNCSPVYVGGTFSWNQLAALDASNWTGTRATASFSTNKTIITATSSSSVKFISFPITKSHKYFVSATLTAPDASLVIGIYDSSQANSAVVRSDFVDVGETLSVSAIWDSDSNGDSFRVQLGTGAASGNTGEADELVFTDITLMFGATIADYAYSLESGNAGDGVAWLKSQGFFKEDYYAYDAGSLQSVETEKAINTGIDPANIHTYPLGHAKLRGIPSLDANHNIVYSGDTYESNGKITRRFAEITLNGSESWTRRGTNYYFGYKVGDYGTVVNYHSVSTQYEAVAISTSNTIIGVTLINSSTYNGAFINIRPEGFASMTVAQFQALLAANPITVAYELSTPTTESSASFTSLQFAEAGGTEQLVDYAFNHGTRDIEIPVGTITDYGVIRFAGYLIAVRNSQDNFTPIPLEYMRYESYTIAPEQRLDLDSTRDTTGLLHRTVLAHTATKVTFNVPSMESWRIQELFDYFRTAFKQTNGDTLSHKLELKYYDEWADDYKTGIMYMPDIQFQIRNIDRDARLINYQEIKITFIEY